VTSIEWTDETWNPVTGCHKVSEGCRHCHCPGRARKRRWPFAIRKALHRWRMCRRSPGELDLVVVKVDTCTARFECEVCGARQSHTLSKEVAWVLGLSSEVSEKAGKEAGA
jgi:hypothetical protein